MRQLFEGIGYRRRRQTYSALYIETLSKSGKANRKDLPKRELKSLYLKEKLAQIADQPGVSLQTVHRNLIVIER